MRLLPLALGLLGLLATSALGKKAPRCPDASWIVVGQRLVPGATAAPTDAVTIAGRKIGVASGCPPKRGAVTATSKGTSVHARWARCGTARRVDLKALIDAGCSGMTGTVKAKGSAPQSFRATSDDGINAPGSTTTTTTGPGSTTTT